MTSIRAFGDLDQVTLYHVDDLRARQMKTGSSARRESIQHLASLSRKLLLVIRIRHQRDVGLLLQQLGNHADEVRLRELSSLFTSRPHLTEEDRAAITHMATRLQNPSPHHPELLSGPQLRNRTPIMTTRTQSLDLCVISSAFQIDRPAPATELNKAVFTWSL